MMKPNPRERKQKGGTCKETREEEMGRSLKGKGRGKGIGGEKLTQYISSLIF